MTTQMEEPAVKIHWLKKSEPVAPVDAQQLAEVFAAGLWQYEDVVLSVTDLFVLCTAAQAAVRMPDCPPAFAKVLQEFLRAGSQSQTFPEPMRQLLAQQMAGDLEDEKGQQ